MPQLVDHRGQPISSSFKKARPPRVGPSYGDWAGREQVMPWKLYPYAPIFNFNLDNLVLSDYRQMRDHPQVNASLSLLSFMVHQIEWHIEVDDKPMKEFLEQQVEEMWTRMVRALCQAFWAGYSPTALEYEYDPNERKFVISKFKDLYPEDCEVKWKEVRGAPGKNPHSIPPKFKIFDGIRQWGTPDIPVLNSLWYPFMMENGNFYGHKLLRAAYMPWFYSMLMHMFASRYYERFGEPTPIGRAPTDSDVDMGGGELVSGREAMERILSSIRSRAVVTLPSDRDPVTKEFDYIVEYLESEMRGIDFERYMSRLDEEISLGIFTPILMFKTGEVGSNNLGVQHAQTFLWMLNAIIGDMKYFIEKYVLYRLVDFNWGPKAPRPKFCWKKLGQENLETTRAIILELLRNQAVKVDLEQLGEFLGMTVTEVRQVTEPPAAGNEPETDPRVGRDKPDREKPRGTDEPRATGRKVAARIATQVRKEWKAGTLGTATIEIGYARRMTEAFMSEGYEEDIATKKVTDMYGRLSHAIQDMTSIAGEFSGPNDFMSLVERHIDNALESASA